MAWVGRDEFAERWPLIRRRRANARKGDDTFRDLVSTKVTPVGQAFASQKLGEENHPLEKSKSTQMIRRRNGPLPKTGSPSSYRVGNGICLGVKLARVDQLRRG